MKPALLSVLLLALPLRAVPQQPAQQMPPQEPSIYDLKGPIRDYVREANALTRTLCVQALEAPDEKTLQEILNEVELAFRSRAEAAMYWRRQVRTEKENLDSFSPEERSGPDSEEFRQRANDLRYTKRTYGQALALSIVHEQVRERVRGCVGLAVNSLRHPGVTAGTGTGAGSGTGGGAAGAGAELCESQAGPLGCTGKFTGAYQVECTGGGGPATRDAGPGLVAFFSDGTVALRLQGGTTSLTGRIDSSGRVSIVEGDRRFSQRWDGRFAVQPAAGGGSRAVGGGTYESRVIGPQGQVNNACQGTFQLPGAPL